MSGRKEEVTEKLQEPFEFFEFVQKPFDQRELIEAIKAAMAKAKRRPLGAAVVANGSATGASSSAEIQALNEKVARLQAEVDGLKKQMGQLVAFIRQKLQ
jgi:DNA-binding NtrC family response regulator